MAFGIFQLSLVFTIGLYIALASDIAGAIGINEIPLSLSLKDPEDAVISREQNVVLKCEAKSSVPGLSISWFHENTPLLANDTRVQISGDGSLNISKTSAKKMEGSYRCLARNDVGAVLSNPAQLKIATIGREFIEQPDNVNTTEQQPVIFPCHIDSTPDAIIYWERDNKTLPQNARYVPLPSGALLITSTHSIDTGFYRCVVKHKTLKKTKQSRWGQLLVSPPSVTSSPPQFLPLNLSLNITSIVGENVTLPCAVNGWPIPVLRWVYNKDSLISNSSVLHLTNVTTDLSGNYSCIANNVFGEVSMNFTLNIFEIPHFNVTPMSMSYPSARMVRLECKVNGVPPPKVTWLKNGAPLELIGRIKQLNTTLVLSHSFMTDAGIYQCVASNIAGQIWMAARLLPLFSNSRPHPPQNVTCQPFDDNSVCLTWNSPSNVTIQAYSIYLFNSVKGYDFVTNYTYYLANGLEKNSEYTMYVQSYSNDPSDQSNNVSCKTGVQGQRNLQVEFLSESSVQLIWSHVSNDFLCGTKKNLYKVQWKKFDQTYTNVLYTSHFQKTISRLQPSTTYDFRVQSTTNKNDMSPWVTYSPLTNSSEVTVMPTYSHEISSTENHTFSSFVPIQVEVHPISPYSVNLTWSDGDDNLSYMVYCTDVKEKNNRIMESHSNFMEVTNLKPNTLYAFKVHAQNVKGMSSFSQTVEVQTPTDVPSAVQNLRYKVINATAACVTWKSPMFMNGKLLNYVVSYTSNKNLPFEKWHNIYIKEEDIYINQCWSLKQDEISIVLKNLSVDLQYTLVVRAVSETGSGNLAAPITFSTYSKTILLPNSEEETVSGEIDYKQKLGVAVGITISALCILCCVCCIIFRRRCMKRDAIRRTRLTTSNNYYASEVAYSGAPLHMRPDSCATETHEMQQLVMSDGNTHIPPIETTHLDTKGGIGFPNGQLNGNLKNMQMNGHVANGNIHITENPRYDYHSCNGNQNSKKIKRDCILPQLSCLQENAIDNIQELQDGCLDYSPNKPTSNHSLPLHTENSKLPHKVFDVSDYNSNCNSEFVHIYGTKDLDKEVDLNHTQMTYLDESFSALPNRIVSPALAPNG
ncbi:hypothetical protein PPYR_04640 [Photinus pyralis]|uniref:Protogenin n=1 Tax=Photinus pyralis TaxID=7054 RepID=A0A1Y1L2W1_PHOPY|nr:immunoglobulin superfamily DCC subclass member 4-like isoform X1 [Photinus pyralis]KAB0802454.1 hypothetical protein PPYR_04640 [Photinus pyralis]